MQLNVSSCFDLRYLKSPTTIQYTYNANLTIKFIIMISEHKFGSYIYLYENGNRAIVLCGVSIVVFNNTVGYSDFLLIIEQIGYMK